MFGIFLTSRYSTNKNHKNLQYLSLTPITTGFYNNEQISKKDELRGFRAAHLFLFIYKAPWVITRFAERRISIIFRV